MKCKWCESESHIKQGRILLCVKHYRFSQMRASAARNGKTVPSYVELESILARLDELRCPCCKRSMNWLMKQGSSTCITLQHNRSGGHKLICLACNTRHAAMGGDSFYEKKDGFRTCPDCRTEKPIDQFWRNSERMDKTHTYCKECSYARYKKWQAENRDAFNQKRRVYYHMRKDSGNPIPRKP